MLPPGKRAMTTGSVHVLPPCVEPLPLYRPRNPQASDLWRLMDRHFQTFQRVYDERFQPKYGFWRPVVERSVRAFLDCGDLHHGFAGVRCADCHHEMFVAFSCKQRCTCPSCHQKRALLTAIHVAEDVCFPVAHRQVVLTIPKRLRLHTRFDRTLLGKLSSCAAACIQDEIRRALGREDVVPGMIGAIQTFGEVLNFQPHIHALVTCGAFTARGEFLEVPEFDMHRLHAAWREAVFALYLAEGKIEPEVVQNMRTWQHSGFSVDQSVLLAAGVRWSSEIWRSDSAAFAARGGNIPIPILWPGLRERKAFRCTSMRVAGQTRKGRRGRAVWLNDSLPTPLTPPA